MARIVTVQFALLKAWHGSRTSAESGSYIRRGKSKNSALEPAAKTSMVAEIRRLGAVAREIRARAEEPANGCALTEPLAFCTHHD